MSENGRKTEMQSPQQVAYRALALGALVMRGVLEQHERVSRTDQARLANEAGVRGLLAWMRAEKLFKRQSAEEERLFRGALGKWTYDEVTTASWRVEALGTLLWAIQKFEALPPYDTLFDLREALDPIPFYEPTDTFADGAVLRPESDIRRARNAAQLWHWRSRLRYADPAPGAGMTVPEIIAEAAARAHHQGEIDAPIAGDFPAFDKAFAALDEDEYGRVAATAVERHLALNWVCGYAEDWDRTPVEV